MIVAQKQTVGLNEGGRPQKTPTRMEEVSKARLAEAGIDYKLSARAQKIATVQRVRTVRTRMPQDATKGGFPVEVAAEVKFQARKRAYGIDRKPLIYLVAGAGFEPGTFGL